MTSGPIEFGIAHIGKPYMHSNCTIHLKVSIFLVRVAMGYCDWSCKDYRTQHKQAEHVRGSWFCPPPAPPPHAVIVTSRIMFIHMPTNGAGERFEGFMHHDIMGLRIAVTTYWTCIYTYISCQTRREHMLMWLGWICVAFPRFEHREHRSRDDMGVIFMFRELMWGVYITENNTSELYIWFGGCDMGASFC